MKVRIWSILDPAPSAAAYIGIIYQNIVSKKDLQEKTAITL